MKLLFALAMMACGIGAYAQQSQTTISALLQQNARISPAKPVADKTTGIDSRLVATVLSYHDGSGFKPNDSAVLQYTGNNGWDYSTQSWKSDSISSWTFTPANSLWNMHRKVYQHLANDRIMHWFSKIQVSGVWLDGRKTIYTYNNGYVATKEEQSYPAGVLTPDSRTTNSYNTDMQTTMTIWETWNTSTSQWEHSSTMTNHYNSFKQNDTSWVQSLISGSARAIKTYNNDKLTSELVQILLNGNWLNSAKTAFFYDAGGNAISEDSENWNNNTSTWHKSKRKERSFDNHGRMLVEKDAYWNGSAYQYSTKTTYTYNQFGRVLTEETQTWDNINNQWHYNSGNHRIVNYYEIYTNDVKTITFDKNQLKVYPNPATDQITLSASLAREQPVTINLCDMNGRIIRQLTEQAGMQFQTNISVSDIVAGHYIINVHGINEIASITIAIAH